MSGNSFDFSPTCEVTKHHSPDVSLRGKF